MKGRAGLDLAVGDGLADALGIDLGEQWQQVERAVSRRVVLQVAAENRFEIGRRFEDASEQLAATLLAVRSKLPADCRQSTELQVLAITAGGTPGLETRKAQESFHRKTGVRLQRKSLTPNKSLDLREHLGTGRSD